MNDEWLAGLSAARKGPVTYYAHRNADFQSTITLNAEYASSTLRGEVRAYPDAASSLGSFTASSATVASGTTTFTISIPKATIAAMPAPAPGDGEITFVYDLLLTPSGGTEDVLFAGEFKVLGKVAA